MKISEMFGTLSQALREHGDIEVWVAVGNGPDAEITSTSIALNAKKPGQEGRISYVCLNGTPPDPA